MPDTQISEEMVERACEAFVNTNDLLGTQMRAALKAALSGHVVGWRTMDSAPKDGTWFLAYRRSASFGVYSTLVAVCWDQESNDFVWPTDIFDVYNPPDLSAHDERGFLEVDVYESQGSFTHWQPLPAPPVQEMERG